MRPSTSRGVGRARGAASALLASLLALVLVTGPAAASPAVAPAAAPAAGDGARAVVDVTDFGADPSGAQDSTPAVAAALDHAKDLGGPTRVVFPTGTYQLYPDRAPVRELYVSNTVGADQRYKDKRIAILVEDMDDVVVDGEGSRLVMHGEQTIFASIRSRDVVFEDFTAEWVAPRTLDLTVVAAGTTNGQTYRDLRVPDGYGYAVDGTTVRWSGETSPYTGVPYWTDQGAFGYQQVVDLATGRSSRGSWDGASTNPFAGVSAITDLGDGRLRSSTRRRPRPPRSGACSRCAARTGTRPPGSSGRASARPCATRRSATCTGSASSRSSPRTSRSTACGSAPRPTRGARAPRRPTSCRSRAGAAP